MDTSIVGRTQLGAELHVDPGAGYEVRCFPGLTSGRPFVVLQVGELCLFFDADEAVCEFIDALAKAAQLLAVASSGTRPRPVPALEPASARPGGPIHGTSGAGVAS